MPEVAVVVPVFNNSATLLEMEQALTAALDGLHRDWAVIWVDDASTDGSWTWVHQLCRDSTVHRGIRLDRNRGQSLAVCAGMAHATDASVVVTIDADLEYSPSEIPAMVSAVTGPRTFVAGIRPGAGQIEWTSRVFNAAVRVLTGDHVGDVGCGFMAVGAELAAATAGSGARQLALRPLLADLAGVTHRHPVRHDPAPTSATGLRRRIHIAADVLAADPRPARRLGTLALLAGLVAGTAAATRRTGTASATGAISALAGLSALGLTGRRSTLRRRFVADPPRVVEVTGRGGAGSAPDAGTRLRR